MGLVLLSAIWGPLNTGLTVFVNEVPSLYTGSHGKCCNECKLRNLSNDAADGNDNAVKQ